jgi:DNA end-binding protein Ku
MAERLVAEMTDEWNPEEYENTYRHDLMKRIEEKIKNRETHKLTPAEKTREPRKSAQVIDLMDVLRKSLKQTGGDDAATPARNTRRPARRASSRRRSTATPRARKRA